MTDKIFAQGIFFERRDSAPDYVIGSLSFKVSEAIAFLETYRTNAGYVNCDIKVSKEGKKYVELNQWKPEKPKSLQEPKEEPTIEYPEDDISDQVPF